MRRAEKQVFERLGTDGLLRVLDDVMDHARLVRLANTCGLKYPGMRTQSLARQRILADLVRKSGEDDPTRKAIFRALQKETRSAIREWETLSAEQRTARLNDEQLLDAEGNLGLHLFLVATSNGDGEGDRLGGLLGRVPPTPAPPAAAAAQNGERDTGREEARLKKKVAELQKKLQHLDAQLAKSRDAEKQFKRDLIHRKGELAESRMLAERLRRELDAAQTEIQRHSQPSGAEAAASVSTERLAQAVRRLSAEQKKLTHSVTKIIDGHPSGDASRNDSVLKALKTLQSAFERHVKEREQDTVERGQRLDELGAEVRSLRKAVSKPPRRIRAKGAARVGMFIDVQNVYYGARRLKGKLDFDALLETGVGGRRLIQATAYVVESKEIDQSGFIALLQQRGIEVRRKTLKVRADGSMKGDWDMELALDVLDAAPQLDVVVLVSGDGDFTSLVKRVKRMGPRVEVVAFPRNTAKSLIEAADDFQPLDRKFMIHPEPDRAGGRRGRAPTDGATETEAPKAAPASGEKPTAEG